MRYSAMAVANAFIEKAQQEKNHNLTPMKLQKLMFFSQTWYLKSYGDLLFDGYFERWQYGPVLPEIYHEFKKFGAQEIDCFGVDLFNEHSKVELPYHIISFLDQIIKSYGHLSGSQLSWMTHQPETAWSKGNLGTIISTQDMIHGRV